MNVLAPIFLKYLLAPLVVLISILIMNLLAKGKAAMKMKKLIIFILICSIILALPSILGLLRYEFVWGGLLLSIFLYLVLGFCYNLFIHSAAFKTLGIGDSKAKVFFAAFIICVLGGWIYYLAFDYLSKLDYSAWAMSSIVWFFVPIFYAYSRELFSAIPTTFYYHWQVGPSAPESSYWDSLDTFRLMQVTVKVKRKHNESKQTSFSVKVPDDIELGKWFNRFVEDQNARFPDNQMGMDVNGKDCGWIFYTSKWFSFPLFVRVLDFNKTVLENKIDNKSTIYIRRVANVKEKK
ncbi:MAG: TssN family type VI secretion system protein [Flavobacteriaceae bacterium]|nr:TssN family type VI secretion system protein [Flavobacteriaceae bacterium]